VLKSESPLAFQFVRNGTASIAAMAPGANTAVSLAGQRFSPPKKYLAKALV
jgi:hypothetical protein